MQIQKINGFQQQNTKSQNTSFGMKIYMDKALYKNVSDVLDKIPAETGFKKNSKVINKIRDFIKNFAKSAAEHNTNPKNHRLFADAIKIKDIQFYHDNGKGLDCIANGRKTFEVPSTELKESLKKLEREPYTLEIQVLTENGIRVSNAQKGDNPVDWIKHIQNETIKQIEEKNPDVYFDMIQPSTMKGVRQPLYPG